MKKLFTTLLSSTLLFTALSANDVLKGSGASFPYSVYQKWIKAYYDATGI
jgi:phosphate transport system substrate-binding protein